MRIALKTFIGLLVAVLLAAVPAPTLAMEMKPGKGVTVQPARATWATGFFQEAVNKT